MKDQHLQAQLEKKMISCVLEMLEIIEEREKSIPSSLFSREELKKKLLLLQRKHVKGVTDAKLLYRLQTVFDDINRLFLEGTVDENKLSNADAVSASP